MLRLVRLDGIGSGLGVLGGFWGHDMQFARSPWGGGEFVAGTPGRWSSLARCGMIGAVPVEELRYEHGKAGGVRLRGGGGGMASQHATNCMGKIGGRWNSRRKEIEQCGICGYSPWCCFCSSGR